MWTAIYRTSDGHLISMATVVADPLPRGLAAKNVEPHRHGYQWNTNLLDWELAPEPPPDVDRVDEFIDLLPTALSPSDEAMIRSGLVALLDVERHRDPVDPYPIRRP